MTPPYCASTFALAALLASSQARAALPPEPGCASTIIAADAATEARFPHLMERIEREFHGRVDVDPCARVALSLDREHGLKLAVTLLDGRAALRHVASAEEVIPALQALLLVPEPSLAEASTAPEAQTRAGRVEPGTAPARSGRRAGRDSIPPASRSVEAPSWSPRIELSVLTGPRSGDGQLGIGAGALSLVELDGWLFGFEGRVDSYRPLFGGDSDSALELAVLLGRRLDFGSVALDLTLGPGVAIRGVSFSEERSNVQGGTRMAPPPAQPTPEEGPVPRVLLGARLGFNPHAVFRTFVGVDGELGPSRVASNAEPGGARLPGFCLGLALGATVGSR